MQRQYNSRGDRDQFPIALVAIIAVAFAVIIAIVLIFAYFSPNYGYYGYGWGGGMMGWMGFPMLFMFPIGLIILVVIAYVIYRGVWWGGGCCGGHRGYYGRYRSDEERETAMEILRRRYANGEITKEQFEQMKRDITG